MKRNLLSQLHVRRMDIVPTLAELAFSANSTVAQELLSSLKKGDLIRLVSSSINPLIYKDASQFRLDYFLVEAFSKYPFWDLKIDRQAVALAKFSETERICKETNARLSSLRNFSFETSSIFEMARRKIERLLLPFSWDRCVPYFGFGPGSTTRVKKKHADLYYKFSGIPECTSNSFPIAKAALTWFSLWGGSIDPCPTVGNRVITVPKNAKTDRVIAKEPCMNIFIQKGIGGVIRGRLKKVGVDLDDQRKNQILAREGSIMDDLCTVDLSSASDTVSLELVRYLLPPCWYEAISSCRSPRGVLPSGEVVTYQKVSSMGNGNTFELESLIFWALSSACRSYSGCLDRRMAIYGDDIVIPSAYYELLKSTLEFAGFMVNSKKTHVSGPFRESCGKHYFQGVDVTPIYFKDKVDCIPRYIWCCNQLKRWSRHEVYGLDPTLKPMWEKSHSMLHGFWSRPRIPDGIGDGALIGDFDEVVPKKAPRGFHGWSVCFFSETKKTFLPEGHAALLKSLWNLSKKPYPQRSGMLVSTLPVYTDKVQYKLCRSQVWQWPSYGSWHSCS